MFTSMLSGCVFSVKISKQAHTPLHKTLVMCAPFFGYIIIYSIAHPYDFVITIIGSFNMKPYFARVKRERLDN